MKITNARVLPTLNADLPASFEEQVDGRMAYELEGDAVYLMKAWLLEAQPDFKQTELYLALRDLFNSFPEHEEVLMHPR